MNPSAITLIAELKSESSIVRICLELVWDFDLNQAAEARVVLLPEPSSAL